jgi:hypothetical protein
MMRTTILILLAFTAGPALAQGRPADTVAPGDAGSRPPGDLTPHDVAGKWLLDANGATIGRIEGADSEKATVRTKDGAKITVQMARLSLGNGPNTVIEAGNSAADKLNRIEAGIGR